MKRKITALMLALTTLTSVSAVNVSAAENGYVEIFVSPAGSDDNPGTADKPLKTAIAARNKVRELKKSGGLGEKGTVVNFREGTYAFSEALSLNEEDSGTEESPITYRAYLDEEVSFIGGVDIAPSAFEEVKDESILNRLVDRNMQGKLYRVNLFKEGVKEIPKPYLLGTYSYWQVAGTQGEGDCVIMADLVEALGYDRKAAKSPELFVDDEIMEVAKYPNSGYLSVEGITEPGPFMRNWNDDIVGSSDWVAPADRIPTPFRFTAKSISERLKYWQTADQAIMWGRWYYDWATQSVPLAKVNPESCEITSAVPSAFSIRTNQAWYIYNLLEEIDEPGEYFMDQKTGYLYYYPTKDMSSIKSVVLTLLDGNVVDIHNAKYINFKGIDVGRSRRSAFNLENCENVHISDADISYTASMAVKIYNSTNCTVKDSHIHDVDGGVEINNCGDRANLIRGNCGVENCEIDNFARLTKTYTTAVNLSNGCGNYARNNEIHNAQHMAVGFSGPYHEISFNNIYNVCQEADDSGVIYTGRSLATHWGSVVKNNYIHDCTPNVTFRIGTIAVYLDDFLSGVTVAGNVIENMQLAGMFSGYNNIWTNNIFINCTSNSVVTAFSANISAAGLRPTLIDGWKAATYKTNDAWKKAFPALYALTEDNLKNDIVTTGNVVANNYSWNSAGYDIIETMRKSPDNVIKDNVESVRDPGFVDAENKVYLLKENAQIFKDLPDFKPIPFTRIGRYEKRAQERISKAVVMTIASPYVFVDGEKKMINDSEQEQMPVIINNSTYVPLRFVGEAFDADVSFDDATRQAQISNDEITLNFSLDDLAKVSKNGEEKALENPLRVIGGRTYVPLRAVSELLDKEVFWDDSGFIAVSDTENLFNSEADGSMIDYLRNKLSMY